MRRLNDDRGSVLLLIIGTTTLALALIVGVMDATSLYLERKRLFTIADGAALVAAESFDPRLGLVAGRPQLSDSSVRAATTDYLGHLSSQARHGAFLETTDTPDARTAEVTMRVLWHPPVISVFVPAGISLTVTARARTMY
jgi:hypothetical protein